MVQHPLANWAECGLLACAVAFVVSGTFDVIYDIWWLWITARSKMRHIGNEFRIGPTVERPAAILIPAFRESEIIGQTLTHILRTMKHSHYRVFVATYDNDPETRAKVDAVALCDGRVVSVQNHYDGPTTKGQCLNTIFDAIECWEARTGDRFSTFLFHDAEDIVHPRSLELCSQALIHHKAVQIPILPVAQPWTSLVHWVYADEFAEGQLKDLVVRSEQSGFVPFLGVGFGLSRELIERARYGNSGQIFSSQSQTEDYSLALQLARWGISVKYLPPRMDAEGLVANRASFPTQFLAAVKQRSRWIIGICLEEWRETGWRGPFRLRFALAKDRRMLLAPLLAVTTVICVSTIFLAGSKPSNDCRTIIFDAAWVFTLLRCWQRAFFVSQIYGVEHGVLSLARLPLAVALNVAATCRAIWIFAWHLHNGKPIRWSKTTHMGSSLDGSFDPSAAVWFATADPSSNTDSGIATRTF